MGDFVIFSMLTGYVARCGIPLLAVAFVGVLSGLTVTFFRLALAMQRTVLPALPLSVALTCFLVGVETIVIVPVVNKLNSDGIAL